MSRLPVPARVRSLTVTAILVAALVGVRSEAAPNDPLFGRQWGLRQIQAETAWNTTRGSGITVAVVDTGADMGHPDLAGRLIAGRDFVNRDDDAQDDERGGGHGTHVSGIIVAVSGNGLGISGVASKAKVLATKVIGSGGSGTTENVIQGIRYAQTRVRR